MSKFKKSAVALVVGFIAFAAQAAGGSAGGSADITVTTSILPVCKFFTTSATIAVGGIDPSGSGDKTGDASLTYNCTKGVTPTFTVAGGANQELTASTAMAASGGATAALVKMAYSIAQVGSSGEGTGFDPGTSLTVTFRATVAESVYRTAAADNNYSGTVTVTIAP